MSEVPANKRRGRPPDVDSAETRERLLLVAREAFARNGYDATTNREIAEAAGITTGAIYHYYASKADLYYAVDEQVQYSVHAAMEKAAATHGTLLARFSAVLDEAVELNRYDGSVGAFLVGMIGETKRHPELAERLKPLNRMTNDVLHSMVIDAQRTGELAPGVDPRCVVDLLNVVLAGLANFGNQIGDADRHAAAVAAFQHALAGTLLRAHTSE